MLNNVSLNAAKTEFIVFGSKQLLRKLTKPITATIHYSIFSTADSTKNVSVWLIQEINFERRISKIIRACYLQIENMLE